VSRQSPPIATVRLLCPVSRHRSQRSDFYVPSGKRNHYDRIYVPSCGRPPPFRPPGQLFHATTAIRRGSSSSTGSHAGCEHFNLSRCSPRAAPSAYGQDYNCGNNEITTSEECMKHFIVVKVLTFVRPGATKFFRHYGQPPPSGLKNGSIIMASRHQGRGLRAHPPPYARRLASRISPLSGSRSNSIILRLPYKGSVRLNKEHEAFVFSV
jgi:hypothetical protein